MKFFSLIFPYLEMFIMWANSKERQWCGLQKLHLDGNLYSNMKLVLWVYINQEKQAMSQLMQLVYIL